MNSTLLRKKLHFPSDLTIMSLMKIKLHHPAREVTIKGPKQAGLLLKELNLSKEAHLVILGEELATEETVLQDDAVVEIRPVISGGLL